jgi:hypothetical protein
MKTYAEKEKQKPFDWNKFLDKAIAGDTTRNEEAKAELLANDWVTCACGNQCAIIPRDEEGEPIDEELQELGNDFSNHINDKDWEGAKRCLVDIESRSALLIDQKIKEAKELLTFAEGWVFPK